MNVEKLKTKIALVQSDGFSLYRFQGGLMRRLVACGCEVVAIVPRSSYNVAISKLGVRCINVPIHRFLSPINDVCLVLRLYRVFKNEHFNIVHTISIKPNIFGSIAAFFARIETRVCLVCGLGFTFTGGQPLWFRPIRWAVSALYKVGLACADRVWFANEDDSADFIRRKLVRSEKALVIKSDGINTVEYSPYSVKPAILSDLRRELGIPDEARCVVMVAARMVWSKGVKEFIEMARALRDGEPAWWFIMVTPNDPGTPDAVPRSFIETHRSDNLVVIDRFRNDVMDITALADIVVLPSYYREGVPNVLLEGLALAKPIVTTASFGCKECVDDGKNGYLVPIRNTAALIAKTRVLMQNPELRRTFGQRSRWKAEHEFDEAIVVRRVMNELYNLQT